MKLQLPKTYLKFLFVCALFLSSISSRSQTYSQVTTVGGLVDGVYLIVGDSTNDGLMVNTITTGTNPYINYSSISNPGATITSGVTSANEFEVTVVAGVITIYNSSVGYVSWGRTGVTGNAANFYNGTVASTEQWTATVTSGLWSLSNVGTPARLLQWNSASPRFAAYTSAQVKLKLYKKNVTAPTVTTVAATSIATNGATLNGTINANGTTTNASFEYGTSASYGSSVTASPSTVTGTSATSIAATIGSLSPNTQYHYRAVGTVSAVPTNGSDMTFYTLANTPGVVVVSNPLQTTIDVTVNSTTENSNPSTTEYAIQETGGQYIQGDGTLGATAVWNTASVWGTKTVTGLTPSTTYTFQVKARNGANVETGFGTTASGTTAVAQTVDYAVVQYPNTTQNITEGANYTVYIRAYEPGLTTLSGMQSNLYGWVGYSSTNDNPSNSGWTWVAATFNAEYGNDDEYQATLSGLLPGTYYYAARFQIGTGSYVYGGSGGTWNNDNVTLNVNADIVDYANLQYPSSATITEGNTVTVYAQVYEPGITPGAGQGSGITAEIGYSSSNTTPDGTWTWLSTTYNTDSGNNDEYQASLGTGLAPGTYYYASRFKKSSSSTYVYGGTGGIWNNDSGVLTVNPAAPVVTAGSPTGTYNTSFTYNIVASNSPTSYALSSGSFPPGLTLNTSTGEISGTPTSAGSFTANVTASNAGGTSAPAALNFTINKANQTITFAALSAKTYGDAAFSLTGTASSGLTVSYASSNTAVATVSGNTVTIIGAGTTNITASQAGDTNYNPATDVVQSLSVNPKALTITGVTANNKVQDGTTTATLSGTPTLNGVVTGDEADVTISGTPTATFASATPGTGIAVTVTGYTLSGAKASFYTVSQPTGLTADITGLGAPTANAASAILPTGFTANWSAVTGSSSYRLDVSLYSDFQTPGSPVTVNEGFTTYTSGTSFNGFTLPASAGNYTSTASSGPSGPNSVQLNTNNTSVITQSFPGAITQFSFWLRNNSWGSIVSTNYMLVEGYNGTSWVTIQSIPSTSVANTSGPSGGSTFTYNSTSSPSLPSNITQVRLTLFKTTGNVALDDFNVTYNTSTPSYVSGYQDLNVGNVTSYAVTGLNPETTYYYRVRAVNGSVASANSNVVSVTTKPTSCTWNGSAWSNTTGPDADIEAVIAGAYSTTANGEFTAKKVTVNSGSLTVNTGDTITIINELVNTLTAADVVVENNANLLQGGTTNSNSGAITVNRNSSALLRLDYTLWSSPVASQNLLSFSPNTLTNRFYTYNTNTNLYNAISSPSTTSFDTAKGYLIRVPNNHPSVTPTVYNGVFAGVPNNGNITFTMVDGGAGQRFNAVGNPYPSPIDAVDFVTGNSNITGTLYFWRKTNNTASPSYCTWTTGGFVSNNEAQVYDPNDVIQTGQGFFVEANGSGTSLSFDNNMRIDNHANQFFRVANTLEKHRLWLNVTNGAGLFSQTMIGYIENATNGFDAAIDGRYINDGEVALTTMIDNVDYAIQGKSLPFDATDVVPLKLTVTTAGNYTISLDHVDGLFSASQDVFLRDNQTGFVQDLKAGNYSFTSDAGTFASRFDVIYQSPLGVEVPSLNNQLVVYKNEVGDFVINSGSIEMKSVKVFDLRGRLLNEYSGINATQAKVSGGSANGVLLLQITSVNGVTVTRKVVR